MKYFLHYTNSFSDDKITLLYIEFGFEAVGLYYVILEKLAAQEKPVLEIVLKKQLNIKKRLEKQLLFMYEIEIISLVNGEVFSNNILKNTENYQEKKEKNRKRISKWRENKAIEKNVTCNEHVRNTSNLSKVNISKVNKEKEYSENVIFVFDSIKNNFISKSYENGQYEKSLDVIDRLIRIDKMIEVEIIETCNEIKNHWYGKNIQSIISLRTKKDGLTKIDKLKSYIDSEKKGISGKKENKFEINKDIQKDPNRMKWKI